MWRFSGNSQLTSHYNQFPLSEKNRVATLRQKPGMTLQTPLLQRLVIIERFESL